MSMKRKTSKQLPQGTITITFGEQCETHHGMEKIGEGIVEEGLTVDDLREAQKRFLDMGVEAELTILNDFLPVSKRTEAADAAVLVCRNAVTALLGHVGKGHDNVLTEQMELQWDRKAWMRGRVVNKRARFNLVYGDEAAEPDYAKKRGRTVAWKDIPLTREIRGAIPRLFGDKAQRLNAEGNYYYDPSACGIGFHGDEERKIVVAIRLGEEIPIHYQWFQHGRPIGERAEIDLRGGDMYAMSEKASGFDWKKKKVPTLRHATGCQKFLEIKK